MGSHEEYDGLSPSGFGESIGVGEGLSSEGWEDYISDEYEGF